MGDSGGENLSGFYKSVPFHWLGFKKVEPFVAYDMASFTDNANQYVAKRSAKAASFATGISLKGNPHFYTTIQLAKVSFASAGITAKKDWQAFVAVVVMV